MLMYSINKHEYKMYNIPDGFWDEWKENKAELKAKGFAPFKAWDGWYLAVYNGNKISQGKYEKWQKEQLELLRKIIVNEVYGYNFSDEILASIETDLDNATNDYELFLAVKPYTNNFEKFKECIYKYRFYEQLEDLP